MFPFLLCKNYEKKSDFHCYRAECKRNDTRSNSNSSFGCPYEQSQWLWSCFFSCVHDDAVLNNPVRMMAFRAQKNRFHKERIRGCRFGTHAFTHKKHRNMYIYRATWAGGIFRLVLGSFWPLQGALPSEIKPMRNNHIRKLYVYRMIMRPQYITI